MEEKSRLDDAIQQRQMLSEQSERFWLAFWQAIECTAKKLRDHFHEAIQAKLDDSNTLIEVEAAFRPNTQQSWIKRRPQLQIRFDRSQGKIIVQQSDNVAFPIWGNPFDYRMKLNVETQILRLFRNGTEYTPLALAEKLLADDLCKTKLEAS